MKPEHFVEPCANPVTLQTFISPTDNPGPGASAAAAASSMTETQIDTGPWPGDRHWPMGPGALPGASAYPNLSLCQWHQPAASDSESESLTGRLRSLSLPEARGPGSEAAGSEWPPESGRAGTRLGMPRARRPGPGTGIIRVSASDSDSESEPPARPLTRTWPRGGDPVDSGRIHDHEGNHGIT